MKWIGISLLVLGLISCGAPPSDDAIMTLEAAPPPIPEGVENVEFNRSETPDKTPTESLNEADKEIESETSESVYWGLEEGQPLTIMWEELMPEGSEEELQREYEDFYAMLEKRYAANTTTLADASAHSDIAEGSEFDYMPQFGSFEMSKN